MFFLGDIRVELEGVPLLQNRTTMELLLPVKSRLLIEYFAKRAAEDGQTGILLRPKSLGAKRYAFSQKFEFKYSQIDHEFIPGLTRPWDEGFLTPVFFNIAVLNKYSQDPKYRLDLFSETYGTILAQEWTISFGINRGKNVIMWLGDIASLPDEEQYFLRSENVQSDHDLHSEFYEAQIDVQPSPPSKQHELLHQRKALNDLFNKKFGEGLFVLEGEVASVIANLTRPIFWEEKHVSPAIESLNRVFVESINSGFLKRAAKEAGSSKDLKSAGGLKTLQTWIEVALGQTDHAEIMLPFFVLYDFRVFCSHLLSADRRNEMIQSINARLGFQEGHRDFEAVYDRLIEALLDSIHRISIVIEGNPRE
ncbi:hypothetical protein ASE43_02145 [Lysobacter sp. Root983]|nr:hypothetical protein ASE43_02145 [Lysobacter sp. Root983]